MFDRTNSQTLDQILNPKLTRVCIYGRYSLIEELSFLPCYTSYMSFSSEICACGSKMGEKFSKCSTFTELQAYVACETFQGSQ